MDDLKKLPRLAKVSIVLGGYAVAVAVAFSVVALHSILAPSPDGDASDGMKAFGDAILFLVVLAVAAVPPTVAALYFAWPRRA